jgi:hypothetical protein
VAIEIIEAYSILPEHASAVVQLMDQYACQPMDGGEALSSFARANLVSELLKRDDVLPV